ncbi:MAG: GxxExxY protein [Pirellulales bacterium]
MERTENEIAKEIVDAAFKIHQRLGPGLLESVYEAILAYELRKEGTGSISTGRSPSRLG